MATHQEIREKLGKILAEKARVKSGTFMKKIHKVRKKWNCFENVAENVDITHFISIIWQRMRFINVTFFAILLINWRKYIVSHRKIKLKMKGHPVIVNHRWPIFSALVHIVYCLCMSVYRLGQATSSMCCVCLIALVTSGARARHTGMSCGRTITRFPLLLNSKTFFHTRRYVLTKIFDIL